MYIFNELSYQDKDSNEIIMNFNDMKIDKFLNDMYEISCIESFKFYSKENNYDCNNDLILLRKYKHSIVKIIKDKLFESSKEEYKTISYINLFDLFKENFKENVIQNKYNNRKFIYIILYYIFFYIYLINNNNLI